MYIPELTYPGSFLLDDRNGRLSSEINGQFWRLQDVLAEAAMALGYFEHVCATQRPYPSLAQRDAEMEQIYANAERLAEESGVDARDGDRYRELGDRAEREFHRERWKKGQLPEDFEQRAKFMHAKSFLHALDRMERLLCLLVATPGVPSGVADSKNRFDAFFPHLRGLRNSVQHFEDRSRGLGPYEKPIVPRAVDNDIIKAPAGVVMITESFTRNGFGGTMANGEYGEVEISRAALAKATQVVQDMIDSFEWVEFGSVRHWPSR
jgi:hypothetical protein